MQQGRDAKDPYRVRAGGVWYWVDPTADVEVGDTVILYLASGGAHIVELLSARDETPVRFATPQGERIELSAADIAALHLAAVDDEQD